MTLHRLAGPAFAALACACATPFAQGQTPGEIPNPGTYKGSMELQRQYDQQQQQQRDQQQQGQQQRDQQWNSTVRQQQAQQNAAVAQGQDVLRTWQKRPPLAPDHNPLLGRWNSQGTAGRPAAGGGDMAALAQSLIGGMTAGMCDSMLGRGLIEFRPAALVAIAANGSEHVLYHLEYRGGGSRVVVLPKDARTFTHMIIDFDRPDHGTVAAVGCGLTRVGAARGLAQSAPEPANDWASTCSSPMHGGTDIYVARSSIRRSGDAVQMWDLYDFKTVQTIAGSRVLSARNQYEYDCRGMRRRMLYSQGFAEHMAKGPMVAGGEGAASWERISAGSFVDACYVKTACAKP
ncbi:MAG TPA: surface-adhesin E family protein [Caldimonas sp.]|nr:surface-adhesin E family protein [Caldimonas sp.]HEX4234160.1 surface-adhesin E family protein [Caldimonas sp.]